ncbi:MAG TPA: glycosyltransferase family 2 protein, partial [Candidatus Saccharimonadaceae bacterium]|nr:glycosyltransferase family 2 protein [Candidatus Saccharimonadaceae bacterium]
GALNIGYELVRERFPTADTILEMDADTILEEHFIERTEAAMRANDRIGGLCACFLGRRRPGSNLWNRFLIWGQRTEYARFNGNQLTLEAAVLSGTASLLRVKALQRLKAVRGYVWSEVCLAEDLETTKALQQRGWLCMTDRSFVSYTDVMTTWGDLAQQRKRWQRGTLDVIYRLYHRKRCVRREAWSQRLMYVAYPFQVATYAFIGLSSLWWQIAWMPLLATFVLLSLYNGLCSRKAGWRAVLIALLYVPCEVYTFLRYCLLVRSWWLYRKQSVQSW